MKKIIVICFLIVVLLAVQVMIVKSVSKYEPEVDILYAKSRISQKTVITADMLTRKKINISLVHSQAVRNEIDLVGKSALIDIEAGEMMLTSKYGEILEMESIQIEDINNRLYSIEFKPDQVNGWWLKVGQYVDIICVPNDMKTIGLSTSVDTGSKLPAAVESSALPQQQTALELKTENASYSGIVRLENVRIAAIIDEAGIQLTNEQRTVMPKLISFEVKPGQDEYLAWAKSNTRIEISARNEKEE